MSNLQHLIENTNELVFTAEFPSIDGGGMEKVAKEAERLRPWFDAVNSTDNAAAHAHASNLAVAIAIKIHRRESRRRTAGIDADRGPAGFGDDPEAVAADAVHVRVHHRDGGGRRDHRLEAHADERAQQADARDHRDHMANLGNADRMKAGVRTGR